MNDAITFANGEGVAGRVVHIPPELDTKAMRARLGMTPTQFANTYGFSVEDVRDWEAGRRCPDDGIRGYLKLIAAGPDADIDAVLAGEPSETFANVWDVIADTPEGSAIMTLRSDLMRAVEQTVQAWDLAPAAAAKRLRTNQRRLGQILKGRMSKFNTDELIELAVRAGLTPRLEISDALRTIISVSAVGPEQLRVRWTDHTDAEIDLTSWLKTPAFAALRDPDTFAQVRVGAGGHSLVWPDEIAADADSLWRAQLSGR